MARAAQQKVYADFRQGFVTVANPLAYPEGSLKDIVNFDIQDNGTVRLRPGLRQETDVLVSTGYSMENINNVAISLHVWDNVGNDGDRKVAVIQIGTYLYFYNMLDDGIDLSNEVSPRLNLGIPSSKRNISVSTASGSGRLFIAHPSLYPIYLSAPEGYPYFTKNTISPKIRDTWLWEGNTDDDTGKTTVTLSPIHRYNLRNGGWPVSAVVSKEENPDNGTEWADPILHTKEKRARYPTIFIPFAAGRAGGGDTLNEQNAYNPWAVDNDYFGNTTIPVGHRIVDAASWERYGEGLDPLSSYSGGLIPTDLRRRYAWTQKPTAIEFYADRVWYTGQKGYQETDLSPGVQYNHSDNIDVSNTLYFSQQLSGNLGRADKCYQENDPTAEDVNQLLPTDGGLISIRGAGEILDIKTFGTSLVVFSKQGLWSISGADANSFKTDSYSVNKISNTGPSSKSTISANNNNIYYVANDAIYVLSVDEVTGLPKPVDITSEKIKDFYNDIPYRNKEKAKAFFDTANRCLYMLYSDIESTSEAVSNILYNKCLIFNQDLGAFYKYDISVSSRYIVDGLFYNKDQTVRITDAVVSDTDIVVSDGNPVVVEETYSTAALNNIQLLTIVDSGGAAKFTFSSFTDLENRTDWGEPFKGHVEFGFDAAGDIMRDSLKTPVIISHMERTEDGFEINPEDPDEVELILTNSSSCILSYGWDWATDYKNPQQLYRFNRNYIPANASDTFDYGVDVITTRNRIRGKGHSLGIRLDSEEGKDCRLLGIGILFTQAQRI